ncbi:MAG: site-specific tyrosine recombinase/integron integrase [Brevinema sp.]
MTPSIQNYLRRLRYEKNQSVNTVTAYGHDLQELSEFLGKDIDQASYDEIFDFLITVKEEKQLNTKSLARKISCFRSFYKDLIRLQLREDNPVDKLKTPKITQSLPHIISEDELKKLFTAFEELSYKDENQYFQRIRDLLIFEILYSCGLRVSELCELKTSQIYLEEGIIRVFGKGNKERLLPIGTSLELLLEKYLPIRLMYLNGVDCDYVITSKFRKKVSRMFIWKVLKKYSEDLDITTLHPHMLRHAFATHMLSYGADLRMIQELLGHADISTTEIYTHIDKKALAETVNRYHPLSEI